MEQNHLTNILDLHGLNASDLANAMGVNKSTVSRWGSKKLPAERAIEIEAAVGIPREHLRPDLFRKDQRRAAR